MPGFLVYILKPPICLTIYNLARKELIFPPLRHRLSNITTVETANSKISLQIQRLPFVSILKGTAICS